MKWKAVWGKAHGENMEKPSQISQEELEVFQNKVREVVERHSIAMLFLPVAQVSILINARVDTPTQPVDISTIPTFSTDTVNDELDFALGATINQYLISVVNEMDDLPKTQSETHGS